MKISRATKNNVKTIMNTNRKAGAVNSISSQSNKDEAVGSLYGMSRAAIVTIVVISRVPEKKASRTESFCRISTLLYIKIYLALS